MQDISTKVNIHNADQMVEKISLQYVFIYVCMYTFYFEFNLNFFVHSDEKAFTVTKFLKFLNVDKITQHYLFQRNKN